MIKQPSILLFLMFFIAGFCQKNNTKIENLIGFRGSYLSDIFFQSIGIVSFLDFINFPPIKFSILLFI